MATLVKSFAISGIDAYPVDIETKVTDGQPMITVIGLGDQAIKEAAERIQAAIDEAGYDFPKKKVVISLAPSDKKKFGSHFDLAMALGVLDQIDCMNAKNLSHYGVIGELDLDNHLRGCDDILPMIIAAKKHGFHDVIVPMENMEEAKLVKGINIYGFETLRDVVGFLEGKKIPVYDAPTGESIDGHEHDTVDFSEVKGQQDLIEAVVLAASGGHNMLMIGEPGCGKTMIARRIPTILPEMTEEECLEVTKIYSVSGKTDQEHSLIRERPFRAPHHNASLNSLIGGGANALPGEVSLAHNGVLFLDELAEFSKHTLDGLRQPIEDKLVSVSRVNSAHTFPANFMFVAAMNPCPCGCYPGKKCKCTDYEIIKYRSKVSGPILDRIDIQKWVKSIDYFGIDKEAPSKSSKELREVVTEARKIQFDRYKDEEGIYCNAQMGNGLVEKYCQLDADSRDLLRETCESLGYSTRVIHKFLKLARTSADMDGAEMIRLSDIEKVLSMRDLDYSNSKLLVVK